MYRKLVWMIVFLLSACNLPAGMQAGREARVWIDAPLSGAEAPPGANIQVVAYCRVKSDFSFLASHPLSRATLLYREESDC